MSAAETREALEQAYVEGFRDGIYDSLDLPRSWKNSDTARFAASLPDDEGMVARVADDPAFFQNLRAYCAAKERGYEDYLPEFRVAIARAAIRAINGGKP